MITFRDLNLQDGINQIYRTLISNSELISQDSWNLSDGGYQKFKTKQILLAAEQIKVKKMLLYNCVSNILLDMKDCLFSSLKVLNLTKNNIVSLQMISDINTPCLQSLTLFNNKISCIKNIRRTNFTSLKELSLYKNKILQIDSLSQMNLQKIQKLFLSINLINEITPLLKCSLDNLESTSVRFNFDQNFETYNKMFQKKTINHITIHL